MFDRTFIANLYRSLTPKLGGGGLTPGQLAALREVAILDGTLDEQAIMGVAEPKYRREYVVGFVFNGSKTLLIRKQKPEWQKGLLNGIGGKIEPGETPEYAMRREFNEEAGMLFAEGSWQHRLTLEGPDYAVYFFVVSEPEFGSMYRQMTDEKLHVVDTNDMLPETIYNLRWIIPLLCDAHVTFPITISDRVASADCTGKRQ